jgi:hypothetical protein
MFVSPKRRSAMRRLISKLQIATILVLLGITFLVPAALASTISVGIGAFGPGSTLTTFTGLPTGVEVNGLTVDGIQFAYSLGNGLLVIDGGPGTTNNVVPQNIVSVGNNTGVLTLTLPSFVDTFGYGYALLSNAPIANATSIFLFSGATQVGSLVYNGVPDPSFSGGFAGIQSTIPFSSVRLTFNAAAAPAFAVDNIRTGISTPEPPSVLLMGIGLGTLLLYYRKRSRSWISPGDSGLK